MEISINQAVPFVELSEDRFQSLRKLLLNCWSAEYCLRITPIISDDQDYLKSSLEWSFPQAYYGIYFAVRGIELLRGRYINSMLSVLAACRYHYERGLYKDTRLSITFLDELYMLSRSTLAFTETGPALELVVTAVQQLLLKIIEEAAPAHEAYFMRTLGIDAFMQLVQSMPDYIKTTFLAERVGRIYMQIEHFAEA